jgi:hypothetical protein
VFSHQTKELIAQKNILIKVRRCLSIKCTVPNIPVQWIDVAANLTKEKYNKPSASNMEAKKQVLQHYIVPAPAAT